MTDQINDIVLVGGGLAAARAATTLREEGYDGRITLFAEEPHLPYERPPLSKDLLSDPAQPGPFVQSADWYDDHDVVIHLGDPVTEVDRAAAVVRARSGREAPFDRVLIATGSEARTLPLPGAGLDGVRVLRTLDDSRGLADDLRAVAHVTVVGAGWIGCEVAAAARQLGVEVTMVDPVDAPLARVLGPTIGTVFADLHRAHDVDLRLGRGVAHLHGDGRIQSVSLDDGQQIATDLVVVGIGAVPRVALAEKAGLTIADGVVVDATLQTDDERIFAAGDVASAWHPALGQHLRVEHWANALNQGNTAGRNLLGAGEAYDRVPYFFSDQYDLGLEYSGHAHPDDDLVVRGSLDERSFVAFWLRDDRVTAGMNVNVWDVTDGIQSLIRSAARVDRGALRDPDVALDAVAV